MEQNERRELEGAMPASGTPEEEPGKTAVQEGREKTRRNILHLVAGAYLLYLTYRLGSRFVTEIGTIGWNGDMILSLVGAVVFLLTGGFLLAGPALFAGLRCRLCPLHRTFLFVFLHVRASQLFSASILQQRSGKEKPLPKSSKFIYIRALRRARGGTARSSPPSG